MLGLGVCRRIPSSARERAIFSAGKDGEVGDVGFIVDTAPDVHRDSQAEKGPLEARSSSPTGSLAAWRAGNAAGSSNNHLGSAASIQPHR